jgi:hypothetical protein
MRGKGALEGLIDRLAGLARVEAQGVEDLLKLAVQVLGLDARHRLP